MFRTREQPFWVPDFCPDCLFPRINAHQLLLAKQQEDLSFDESIDNSQEGEPKIRFGYNTNTGGGTSSNNYNNAVNTPDGGGNNEEAKKEKRKNKYKVPVFEMGDLNDSKT